MNNSKKVNLVYLLAASHSGSTLTAMLLGAHPDVCTVGELKANSFGNVDEYRCSCMQKLRNCEFWKKVTKEVEAHGISFNISDAGMDIRTDASPYVLKLLNRLHRGVIFEKIRDALLFLSPNWRENMPKIQKRNAIYIEALSTVSNSSVVVDSSKLGMRLKYLVKNPEINVKVIWLVRDGRGVSLAYKDPAHFADAKNPEMRGGGTGSVYEDARKVKKGAEEWVRCNEEAIEVLNTIPKSSWLKVQYENICRDTDNTLDKIYDFIGLDSSLKEKNFKSVEHHVLGNGMRFDTSDEIILDERWKKELTKEELKEFELVAGDMNRRLGYSN